MMSLNLSCWPRLSEMVVKARHDHNTMPLEYFLTLALAKSKIDLNTAGGISTDDAGLSAEYPDADYTTRLRLMLNISVTAKA